MTQEVREYLKNLFFQYIPTKERYIYIYIYTVENIPYNSKVNKIHCLYPDLYERMFPCRKCVHQ